MKTTVQVVLALLPLLLTPLLGFALAEGYLNLGGGEKDILWAFVWGLWATVFAVVSVVLIWKGWAVGRWIRRAFAVSLGFMAVLWLIAFAVSFSGVLRAAAGAGSGGAP